ncbi:MAG TPA: MBL fold metallo-hydrolase [Gemmatimonadales bacterium]|nr:MBL fold metallo-hydrolase [Gemmatimonadales bacterium]
MVLLGSGTPNPDPDRSGPAVAIVVNGTAYLVDAGAGVMRRAEQANRAGVTALNPGKIGVVFLTHLHSDHTIGLPDVIHTGWIRERTRALQLYGPPGTSAMAMHLTEAYRADIENRRTGLQPHSEDGWRVDAHEVSGGVVYRDSNVTVTAYETPHANWTHALAYRFDTRDRSIVISGDTRASDVAVNICNGCDVLVHEVYATRGFLTRSPDWQKYHADAHTSGTELGAIATKARPKLLLLYHVLLMGATEADLLEEVQNGFAGTVVLGKDLGIY